MSFLKDFLPVLKKHEIVFVKKMQEESDVYTFYFKTNKKCDWIPGQHGLFIIKGDKVKKNGFRGFSIASSPREESIMISTHIPAEPSEFKRALMELKAGDTIVMRGPFGPLYIEDPTKPVILLAGGVGVTPFRAILKSISNQTLEQKNAVSLFYIDKKESFLYKDFFNQTQESSKNIQIRYFKDREQWDKELAEYVKTQQNKALYLISGAPSMIKSTKKALSKMGVDKSNIRVDAFFGY